MDSFAFHCLQSREEADNEQMGGQGRLPRAGDVWVGGGQMKEEPVTGARHSSEKEQSKGLEETSLQLPFGVEEEGERNNRSP